ncbi:hypothetical protein CR51_10995 [Caballeronia megalochromosomata]|nr:hypothetical protein CR51_10995 [Caballeronia megalochromosomata]
MDILVLDDNREFAQSLADLITQMGHRVSISHDCATARRLAEAQPFDVIFADVELPDGDGRHACEGLRMTGASQEAFMIALTGRTELGDNDFPGFEGYMRKPVTYEPLERVLEEWRVALGLPKGTPANQVVTREA